MKSGLKTAPLGIVAAITIAVLCMLAFVFRGNPYEPAVLHYWTYGGAMAFVVALIAARTPAAAALATRGAALIQRPSPGVFAALVGVVTTLIAICFAYRAFSFGASTSDEVAQLWHAKILAHGWLALPPDPNPEFFAIDNVIDRGSWYSHFPVGGPLALVPGILIGAPWLVNPVFAGLAAMLVYHSSRVMFGELQGRVIAIVLALAPNFTMMAGTYMNHVPVLFLSAAAVCALVEWDRAATVRAFIVAAACIGFALGAMATSRPLDAVTVAIVIGGYQAVMVARSRERRADMVLSILVQCVAGFVAVAPLLYANWATNGSAFRFGYDVMWGEGHRIGFHADPWGQPHTLLRGADYAVNYVSQLNFSILLWPVPAMAVVFVGLVAMRRASRWDYLIVGLFAGQLAAYASYWGVGEFLGPRFLFTALPAIVVLAARAPFHVADYEGPVFGRGAAAFVVACLLIAWGPSQSSYSVWGAVDQVRGARRGMRLDFAAITREANAHNALVFVRETFPLRLTHRLWGLNVSRRDAGVILGTRDACSLLAALNRVEPDTTMSPAEKLTYIDKNAQRFIPTPRMARVRDPGVHLNSNASITPECLTELDGDAFVAASFGAALPLEPIGADGRLDGDVIYAVDLGVHNEALRKRFGSRTWYRVMVRELKDRSFDATLLPY